MTAKRRKKYKNQISELLYLLCYKEQESKFEFFKNPSIPIGHKRIKTKAVNLQSKESLP
jgi:hypothetical protein